MRSGGLFVNAKRQSVRVEFIQRTFLAEERIIQLGLASLRGAGGGTGARDETFETPLHGT